MINTINSSNSISNNLPSIKPPISTPPSDPTQEQQKKIQKKFSKARKKKISPKYILAGIMLLLLMIGGGIGLYLTQINQDLRQQADEGGYKGACKDGFTMIDGECVSDIVPDPDPTKKPGGDPDPTATPKPTEAPICTTEAGSCIGTDGESCVEYTDGCEKDELCADPFETCSEIILSNQCETCNESLPPETPNSRCQEGLVCNTDNSTSEVGASGLCILPDETPVVCQTGELNCNDACTEDINCSEVNENWSCYFGEDGAAETGSCRLATNLTSETCQNIVDPTDVPTDPTDVPDDGDDDSSSESSSESNSSATVNINTTVAETTVNNQTQPEYPEQLPESGPEDWLQYLQVGLGALGVGAILLLFL